jgi:hypothetical protein
MGYIKTYMFDVYASHTPEEDAQSPSWPNGLIIIVVSIIIIIIERCTQEVVARQYHPWDQK